MEFTTRLKLHSQTTRLLEDVSQRTGGCVNHGIVTLFDYPVPRIIGHGPARETPL